MHIVYKYKGLLAVCRDTIITNNDALWLMRMCYGEAKGECTREEASAMCWSMINRWTLHPGRKYWKNFLYMVRAFSQPINPRWLEGGSKALENKNSPMCTPEKFKHRQEVCSIAENKIPSTIKQAIKDFQEGKLYPPEQLTETENYQISNWASLKVYPELIEKHPYGIDIGGNWFFEDKQLNEGEVVVRVE